MLCVIEGKLLMEFDDKTIDVKSEEFTFVPKGIDYKPIGVGEVRVLLFVPDTTLNKSDTKS